ncbi:hypothetical protein C2I18_21725 [Paenibacillus sp. PK3_47]|nr:hypothetical protein C2I18_21725 [Paenibacillus sp. PK3_47]
MHTSSAKESGFGWSSGNWSGYAIRGKKQAFRQISGEWMVPFVRPSAKAAYSSAWIGIDGYGNSSLIQTGTGHESVNGIVHYYAWWEILPAAETVIPYPVSPGDRMQALIIRTSPGKWMIQLRNLSRHWVFRTTQRYSGPQASAEWIVEAPQVNGSIAGLARLSPVCFSRCRVNGKSPKLKSSDGGIMIQNKHKVAVPSRPNTRGDAFTVKRPCKNVLPPVHSKLPIQYIHSRK